MSSEKYAVITATSTFKIRYVVSQSELQGFNPDVPLDNTTMINWAQDCVVAEELDEFSQEFLGETIIVSEIRTEEEVLELFDKENEYLKDWTKDKKLEFINNRERKDVN